MNTMPALSSIKTRFPKFFSVPVALEQIAFSLNQLSERDFEILEELMDNKFQKTILSRGKNIISQYRKGNTISLKKIQKEFNNK
jgi:hypothetical protein